MKTTRRKTPASKPGKRVAQQTPDAHYARYLKLVKKLPGVEESISYGTPSIKVKGKILSRLRTEAEGALALYCDFIDREMLLQAAPKVFFLTDHYQNYPTVLVRLDRIRADALSDLVERAWRMRATAKLIADYDKDNTRTKATKS
ncbi:MAG TPA: MmcQ/YjbR family DNA-binding protein [Steroidobacteraceae bacterium]